MRTKAISKDNTVWWMEKTSRTGGPPTKGSRAGGQAYGKYYMWVTDNEINWVVTNFSDFEQTREFIKNYSDTDIKVLLK